MLQLTQLHHIAIICADYEKSKQFYCSVLGFEILAETYRAERASYKLDLSLNGHYLIELFSFPSPPPRKTGPEATGLRHICFQVPDLDAAVAVLEDVGVATEPIRIDEYTGKRFVFFWDPDDLPIELYEH